MLENQGGAPPDWNPLSVACPAVVVVLLKPPPGGVASAAYPAGACYPGGT